ncbi:MAG: CPBP family intramembrane metalloprotease [Myxococcaceae bacterium]|nr:CPBP family intramembrane metalloprotease [Myxococcaceae bacterium]
MIVRLARTWLRELADEPTVIMCGSSALLIVSHYQGGTGYFRNVVGNRFDGHPAYTVMSYWWWFGCALVLYLLMPLLLAYATRGSFTRKYGFGLGDWKAGMTVSLLFLVVMLPAAFIASKTKAFAGAYPLAGNSAYTLFLGNGKTETSLGLFAIYELGYVLYFVAWEFFYRGWMLNGLLPRFGRAGAILIPVAPFAIMHLGKAEPEALGSIIAGVALGVLALRTRSFWYGVFVHASVAVWMDVLSASPVLFPTLWSLAS